MVLVALVGLVGAVLGASIQAYGNVKAAEMKAGATHGNDKHKSTIVPGIIAGAIAGVLLGTLGINALDRFRSQMKLSNVPLSIVQTYDFEAYQDPTHTRPWRSFPDSKAHQLVLSSQNARSGKSALRLRASFRPMNEGKKDEYGGVGIFADDVPAIDNNKIAAVSAWVFVPGDDSVRNNKLYAHLIGYTLDDGDFMGIYSEDVELKPGVWTPIFWGATYTTEFKNFTFKSTDRKLTELYITVWDSDTPYDGSIYFDDIVIYTLVNK